MPQPTSPAVLMSTRALSRGPSSVVGEARMFEAILTSEYPVRTYIPAPTGDDYIEVDDVLLTSGDRVARFTLGCGPGDGKAAVPPDEEFDEVSGGTVYKVAGKSASPPVNAMALRTPRLFEWSNQAAAQLAAMFVASDPEAALSTRATQLVVGYDALRQEDLLSRRLRVTCRPLALQRHIDLEAEA